VILKFVLLLLRPIEGFLAQWISISTEPRVFVQEHIRLNDTTNFIRAGNFFLSAISSAFLAEVATLHLLGIGNLAEPYYWLFILLTSIPFVLICFLLVRLVVPLPFKDVLHLSFYPLGAGIFAGAVFALVASAVVALLVAVGFIPDIKSDFSQWREALSLNAYYRVAFDCQKERSLLFTIFAAGIGDGFINLKAPFGNISFIRPTITLLYLIIAAIIFMAAVDRRKPIVFGVVLLAAMIAAGATIRSLGYYMNWNAANSGCFENQLLVERGKDLIAASLVKEHAQALQAELDKTVAGWNVLVRAEGRSLFYTYRFKKPVAVDERFYSANSTMQKILLGDYCSQKYWKERDLRVTETHTLYSSEGQRLMSFSISPGDCPE
jgi:hypothetical protein